jgi:hypothetical protein
MLKNRRLAVASPVHAFVVYRIACLILSCVCLWFVSSKMSPNRVFDRSFNVVRNDAEVQRRYGDSLKGA